MTALVVWPRSRHSSRLCRSKSRHPLGLEVSPLSTRGGELLRGAILHRDQYGAKVNVGAVHPVMGRGVSRELVEVIGDVLVALRLDGLLEVHDGQLATVRGHQVSGASILLTVMQ